MTFYLLVVTEDEGYSYSLWKNMSSAKSEMRYLKDKFGLSKDMDIIPVEAYD